MTAEEKQKFRRSKRWSNFRQKMRLRYKKQDALTHKELTRTWNLHHLDMNDKHYMDLSKEDKFLPFNKDTHKFVHWLFRFYRHDPGIIQRLEAIMKLMIMYNPPRVIHHREDDDDGNYF